MAPDIAYVDPYPVPGLTPSALQILQMADAFGQAGARLALVTPTAPVSAAAILGRPIDDRVALTPLADLRKRWFFPFSSHRPFFFQALTWIRYHRPRALFVRNLKLAAWLLPRIGPLPLYFETHELFAQTFREERRERMGWKARRKLKLLEMREALVYRESAGVFALTGALADDLVGRYGLSQRPFILPDGVDALALQAARARPLAPKAPDAPARILYLGSLHPWKGVEGLIEAMHYVNRAELWIAGGEPHRIAALTAQAASLGITERIRFLGKVPPVERFALIGACDVCMLPLAQTSIGSRYTSPLKLFEYMGMGKAVIASDLPSLREVVRHGENGWLVPPEDPVALADALRRLLADPAQCAALGACAAHDAAGYTWHARAGNALDAMGILAATTRPQP